MARSPAPEAAARTALVTGGNRGLGLEVCRQLGRLGLCVILGARNPARGEQAAQALRREGLDARFADLDVSSEESVHGCARALQAEGLRVDVLVNNAGIYPRGQLLKLDTAALQQAMAVHLYGAFWTCRAFVPAMLKAGYGRVVNVSSGYGSIGEGLGGAPAYSLSKAALNAFTFKLAQELRGDVKVNAVCPGWVRTRMGGMLATRGVARGAAGIVWLATLPKDGPNGGFFRDREPIPW
jgi:NAD(P)-dependent dehydrogenase (short-subunit alcohol dehydrogenase family)